MTQLFHDSEEPSWQQLCANVSAKKDERSWEGIFQWNLH